MQRTDFTTVYAGEKRKIMVTENKITWMKDRLQAMGTAEMISRVADIGRHFALWASVKGVQRRTNKTPGNTYHLFKVPELKGQLDGIPGIVEEDVIAIANQWLNHRASFFELRDVPLGDRIDWHRDYSSGVIGPIKYSGFINHRMDVRVGP